MVDALQFAHLLADHDVGEIRRSEPMIIPIGFSEPGAAKGAIIAHAAMPLQPLEAILASKFNMVDVVLVLGNVTVDWWDEMEDTPRTVKDVGEHKLWIAEDSTGSTGGVESSSCDSDTHEEAT